MCSTDIDVMKQFFAWAPILGLVLVTSCVPNRKVVMLQKDDLRRRTLPVDTAVRTYDIQDYDYEVQENDLLSIRFESLTPKDFDFLSKENAQNVNMATPSNALLIGELVDQNGEVPFPVIGGVKVSGLSVFEIQKKLQEEADKFLDSPVVKVRLLNLRVTVLGEVVRESSFTLSNNRVTLLEVLGQAGGLGELADRSKVKVIRQSGSRADIFYVNLLSEDFLKSPLYYVHQNDVIVVPALRQRSYRKYFSQNVGVVLSTMTLISTIILLSINLSAK